MSLLKRKNILCFICIAAALMQPACLQAMQQKSIVSLVSSDFNQQRGDADFLEYIFKLDYSMLVRDHQTYPYFEGQGVKLFNCVSGMPINGRKILTVDDTPVSFVIYFVVNGDKRNYLQDGDGIMPLMGVHSDFRNKGYGKATMKYVISWFKNQGCEQAWLSVNKSNIKAQNLYTTCGFQKTDNVSGGDSYFWNLPLSLGYQTAYMVKNNQKTDTFFSFQ